MYFQSHVHNVKSDTSGCHGSSLCEAVIIVSSIVFLRYQVNTFNLLH